MEYIQCPHCLKKYGVNDKIRGASGKTIRCKGCQESFEITIFSTPSSQPSSEEGHKITEKEQPAAAEKKSGRKVQKSSGRKSHKKLFQVIITSVLGVVLTIALVVAYQFLDNPLPIESAQTEKKQPENRELKEEQAEPKKTKPLVEGKKEQFAEAFRNDETSNSSEKANSELKTSKALTDGKYQGPVNPTDQCKQAAINQWFTDYMITNGSMTGKEYISLLDESSSQTEEVLKLCKDKYLASRITEAAKLGKSPEWIRAGIEMRTSSRYENEENRETEW
ncbi:MAG: zinc-ribbon domain-containing protein [Mariprofundaceae bacterium]